MIIFNSFTIRDDFYDKYCNFGGISLYIIGIALLVYIVWSFKSWI